MKVFTSIGSNPPSTLASSRGNWEASSKRVLNLVLFWNILMLASCSVALSKFYGKENYFDDVLEKLRKVMEKKPIIDGEALELHLVTLKMTSHNVTTMMGFCAGILAVSIIMILAIK